MEVTVISTFNIDVDKLHKQLSSPEHQTKEENKQMIREQFIQAFESTIKTNYRAHPFIRPIFSILDEKGHPHSQTP